MTRQEAFRLLELPDGADKSQIRHAYSEKVKIYHVETHPEEFARLHEAYKTALKAGSQTVPDLDMDFFFRSDIHIPFDTAVRHEEAIPFPEDVLDTDTHQEQTPASPYEDILDSLVEEKPFSIAQCLELTRLIYYKYRYLASSIPAEELPDDDILFFRIPWRDWRDLKWSLLICHPDFIRKQHSPDFLTELCDFLREENKDGAGGISQEFYFALCNAYGFFLTGQEQESRSALLQAIEDILFIHPRHQDYIWNLRQWEDLQTDRRLALFCQEAVHYSQAKGAPEARQAFAESFLDRAELLLMDNPTPQNEFILRALISLPDPLFSQDLSERKREYQRMQKNLFDEFTAAFDPSREGHSLAEDNYIPIARRLAMLKEKYMPQNYWSRVIRSSAFILCLQNWLRPQGCRLALNYYFAYDVWKEVRCLFDGNSPREKRSLIWLQTESYFPEYEKRYQQELLWRSRRIEEAYFQETFPLPRLNLKKWKLLHTARRGAQVRIGEMPSLLAGLYRHDKSSLRFFERLTTTMVHFNFLLIAPTYEENPVPDDMICFLRDEVILYRKKENLTCHLSHAVFYDHLSRAFDSLAECYSYKDYQKQSLYSEDFINTCCKNMYYYDCFVHALSAQEQA